MGSCQPHLLPKAAKEIPRPFAENNPSLAHNRSMVMNTRPPATPKMQNAAAVRAIGKK
jgi:hypothetical protein